MKELKELLSCLNKAQYTVLKKQYQANSVLRNRKLELLCLLYKKKVTNEEDACYLLYQKNKSTAFTHLKLSLKDDLCKFSLSHLPNFDRINSYEVAEIECSKSILIAKILINQGVYNTSYKQLDYAQKLAEKYELTLQKIEIATLLGRKKIKAQSFATHQKYSNIVHQNIVQLDEEMKANDHFISITMPHIYEKNKESQYLDDATQHLALVKSQAKTNKSLNIQYYYLKSAINYFLITQKYELALNTAYECLELIQTKDAVYSPARLSVIYCQIAEAHMELKESDLAILQIRKGMAKVNKNHLGYLVCLLILFSAQLSKGQLSLAEQTIKQAAKHKIAASNTYYFYRIIYYKALLAFQKGELQQAWKLLTTNSKLQKDSTGWLLGFKLTELMLLIDLKEEQIIPLRLDAFKQLILRQPRLKESRYKYILDILRYLKTNKYDFNITHQKHSELLNKLRSSKGIFYRDPMAFELIAFEDWFERNTKK